MNEKVLIEVHMIGRILESAKAVDAKFLKNKAAALGALAQQLE